MQRRFLLIPWTSGFSHELSWISEFLKSEFKSEFLTSMNICWIWWIFYDCSHTTISPIFMHTPMNTYTLIIKKIELKNDIIQFYTIPKSFTLFKRDDSNQTKLKININHLLHVSPLKKVKNFAVVMTIKFIPAKRLKKSGWKDVSKFTCVT